MRGQVQTVGRSRGRTRVVLTLAALVVSAPARAQEATGGGTPDDPIVLAADRVRYWDEGPRRWILLDGHTSVLQGTEGLRADRAVARVETATRGDGPAYQIEVYAEGGARRTSELGSDATSLRLIRFTRGEVRFRTLGEGGVLRLDRAPGDRTLLALGFPAPAPSVLSAPGPAPEAAEEQPAPAPPVVHLGTPVVQPEASPTAALAPRDPAVRPAQLEGDAGLESGAPAMPGFNDTGLPDTRPPAELEGETVPAPVVPESESGAGEKPVTESPPTPPGQPGVLVPAPILPGTRRTVTIYPKDSGGRLTSDVKVEPDGRATIILRGGVNLVAEAPRQGIVDVTADNAVIWTRFDKLATPSSGNVQRLDLDPRQPFEVYLEGNVLFRQDKRLVAGNGDQKVVEAQQFYMDLRTEWFLAERGQVSVFDSQFITPIKSIGEEIQQYRTVLGREGNQMLYGPAHIRTERALQTGSRFPNPGYKFRSRSVDLTEVDEPLLGPDGKPVAANPRDPAAPRDKVWRIDSRQNFFFIGAVPVFYWPRVVTDSDDLDPPIRGLTFRSNNYFGQQLMTDWSVFKLAQVRKPPTIDNWNLDLDYLSYRGLALGSELGWSGRDLIDNLVDPYNRDRKGSGYNWPYFGYFDIWGLKENRRVDTLGSGPGVITNGPPGAGKRGYQRDNLPNFQDFRGRWVIRHMQSFLPADAPVDQDFRLQLENAYYSDRHFLEQYYKGLWDMGLDQETLAYLIRQRENRAWSVLASANPMNWQTATQYFPRLDYYRLGDSVLFNRLTWWQHWGADYANTHTDVMVNNPNIFAFQPFDPVSATSGAFSTGRLWTSQELALPLDLTFVRFTPYAQGQLVGWDNQYLTPLPPLTLSGVLPNRDFIRGPQGNVLGRAWGAAGVRANVMAWRAFHGIDSELLNIHDLSHKVNLSADYRTAWSNVRLGQIGVQDQLDDNTYEFVRRYFALINYFGGVLPAQYDPRNLTLRRAISPVTGTTDIQSDMETLQLGLHQRLQTKRGPEGRRQIVDYFVLDLTTTYYPYANRDNFGKPWGQNMYNAEWYVGERTSLISYGWFEFFDITGKPKVNTNPRRANDPFGFSVVTSGISINRPPRGNVFIGYSVVNTGPIFTSALNVAYSYWLSPKWYSSFGTSYDFGNRILLGSTVGITRIGADFLTSIGLTVDPQRQSYQFGFELTPRLSPTVRFGSGGGIARFDSRFAPTQ